MAYQVSPIGDAEFVTDDVESLECGLYDFAVSEGYAD